MRDMRGLPLSRPTGLGQQKQHGKENMPLEVVDRLVSMLNFKSMT